MTIFMRKLFFIVAILSITITGCTNAKQTRKVLHAQGFSQIEITGYKFFACDGEGGFYHTGFKAISPYGYEVSGTVCKGLFFKGSMVRFD